MRLFGRKRPAPQPTKIERIASEMTSGIAREVINRSATVISQLSQKYGVTEQQLREAAKIKLGMNT